MLRLSRSSTALLLALLSLIPCARAQVRPTNPITPVIPTIPGVGIGGGGIGTNGPGAGGIGNIIGGGGNSTVASIVTPTGILVGSQGQALALATDQIAAALGGAAGANAVATNATYAWTITGGRIVSATNTATVTYVADNPGTVTLVAAVTSSGVTYNATTTVTAIAASTAGSITAPALTTAATGQAGATFTASVPPAQNNDRTFRWTTTGDAVITAGANTATATIRAGTPGLKEINCAVTLQRLVTVDLKTFLVVNGDGAPVAVTINNGSGSGTYNGNSRVDIFANPPPAGQVFDRWTGDIAVFGANAPLAPSLAHTVITIPATPVTLTATYKSAPAWTPTTVTGFNPQTQTVGTGPTATTNTLTTNLLYQIPANAQGLVFLLHDASTGAASWFNSPETALLTRDLVAAGYGVAALSSVNRANGIWSNAATLAANFDALNHVAALNRFAADGTYASTKPVFFLGLATGADAAARYAELLATATPPRPIRGAVLYCAAGTETLAVTSKVPQFYALAANDDTLGNAGLATARANAQLMAGRGLTAGTVTNPASPVHAGRFRALSLTSATFTDADATAIWNALKAASLLDTNNYLKALPTNAALTAALPEAYRARAADVAAQLAVSYAAQEFFSDANARVINFLNGRVTGAAGPTPGRMVNLSTRSKLTYVGDSITIGFALGPLSGTDRATLLIRGIGPALIKFGVSTALASPRLAVNDSTGRVIASNQRWDAAGGTATPAQITAAAASVGAFTLAAGDLDAAVLLTNLAPGSYTATITGVNGAIGDVLAEVYDVSKNNTRLTNLSTLAKVAEDGDLVIPGIVVQGANPRTIVARAVGPGLGAFGLPADAIITDPRISVLNSTGATIDTNNNWAQAGAATLNAVFPAVGAFGLTANSADAALVTALTAGNFTLQAGAAPVPANAAGATTPNATGTVLVEVYEVP